MTKYNLTAKELRQIKVVAKYARLQWQSLAARPEIAKDMIRKYYVNAHMASS
jgi:hypothetical protein